MSWLGDILEDVWESVVDYALLPATLVDKLVFDPLSDITGGDIDFSQERFTRDTFRGVGEAILNIVNPPDIPDFKETATGPSQAPIAAARLKRRKSSSTSMFGASSPFVINPPSGGGVNVPDN